MGNGDLDERIGGEPHIGPHNLLDNDSRMHG